MELSIDYECPACGKILPLKLLDLSPGSVRRCRDCQTPLVLTYGGLQNLQRNLAEYCRS